MKIKERLKEMMLGWDLYGFQGKINRNSLRLIFNKVFGVDEVMPAYAKFYVKIKTEDDEEIIPCADQETADYCASVLKRYGFKETEITIVHNKEENK